MSLNNTAVIMSVYRSDSIKYLKESVNSLLSQTLSEFDIYIYRDGLVSAEIEEYLRYISSTVACIKLVTSDRNDGLANALNVLIELVVADGYDFIARMDSDDISLPERLEKQVGFLLENPEVDVCGTSCCEFGASFSLDKKCLPETHDELLDFSIAYCPFIHPTVMFRASVFSSGIRYPVDTELTEDMALWFLLLNKGFRFYNLNEILLNYRLNEATVERRAGFKKGLSEFKIRLHNMFSLNRVTLKNAVLIISRLVFHILPKSVLKFAYKNCR